MLPDVWKEGGSFWKVFVKPGHYFAVSVVVVMKKGREKSGRRKRETRKSHFWSCSGN
jgi:hypothetical protein